MNTHTKAYIHTTSHIHTKTETHTQTHYHIRGHSHSYIHILLTHTLLHTHLTHTHTYTHILLTHTHLHTLVHTHICLMNPPEVFYIGFVSDVETKGRSNIRVKRNFFINHSILNFSSRSTTTLQKKTKNWKFVTSRVRLRFLLCNFWYNQTLGVLYFDKICDVTCPIKVLLVQTSFSGPRKFFERIENVWRYVAG